MGRKPRPKQTVHHLTPQPNTQGRTLKKVYFPFLQSSPEWQHLLPILTMIYLKWNMVMACSCEIYGFISLQFSSLPDQSTTQSNFSVSFPRAELLSVLLGQDYTAKRKTWILRTCGKSTENQRKYHHCVNPWCAPTLNIAWQYFLILGIPEDI